MLRWIFVSVLLIGFVGAVDVDFDCPDEIYAGEEFECNVEVFEGDATYDLKVEVDEERDSVLKIWDGKVWKSGYYYVNDFVRKSEDVLLVVEEEGKYDVVVKLRDGEWRAEFEVGKIQVEESREIEEEGKEDNGTRIGDGISQMDADFVENGGVIELSGDEVIEVENNEWDYISKDGMVVDWLPYGFGLFMIFLVGILVWDKF